MEEDSNVFEGNLEIEETSVVGPVTGLTAVKTHSSATGLPVCQSESMYGS